jgi:hypothetical protein
VARELVITCGNTQKLLFYIECVVLLIRNIWIVLDVVLELRLWTYYEIEQSKTTNVLIWTFRHIKVP